MIVTKLDRLARSTENGLNLVKHWHEQGISIHVLNMELIDRTQEGREIARQNPNYRDGRKKKYTPQQMEHALAMLKKNSYNQVAAMTGISKSTLIRANKEKIK